MPSNITYQIKPLAMPPVGYSEQLATHDERAGAYYRIDHGKTKLKRVAIGTAAGVATMEGEDEERPALCRIHRIAIDFVSHWDILGG